MKVAVYYNNDDVRLVSMPVPQIGPGELLIKTAACGLCGGETMEWYLKPRAPKVLGHELTGTVVARGEGVKDFQIGDRVVAHHHAACMSCEMCNKGFYTLCEKYSELGIDPGGHAEYVRVTAHQAQMDTYILPENVSFLAGVVVEPLGCVLRGIRKTRIHPSDTVVVLGAGFMGLGFTTLRSLWPSTNLVVLDFNDWRLEKARQLGATHTINPNDQDPQEFLREINGGQLADVVYLTAPSKAAWEAAYTLLGKGGMIHINAPPHPDDIAEIKPAEIFFKELTINGAYSASHQDTRDVLNLIKSGRINGETLLTHQFGLDQVSEAIHLMLEVGKSLKPVILPELTTAQPSGEIELTHQTKNIFTD
jgi:L-iditol 2-dehydrogenase